MTMTLDIERLSQAIARMDYDELANLSDVLSSWKWEAPEGSDTRGELDILLGQVIEAQEAYERG